MMRKYILPFLLSLILNEFVFFNILYSQNIDIDLLQKINGQGNPFMDKTFVIITESATPVSLAIPLGVFIKGAATKNDEMKKQSYRIAAGLLVANVVSTGLKYSINRKRPFVTYPGLITKKSSGGSPSFPSGHTATAFSAATSFSLAYPEWYIIAPSFLWAGSVAYSRMYLGVHYPSDLLAGIITGMGFSYLTYKVQQHIDKKREGKNNKTKINGKYE